MSNATLRAKIYEVIFGTDTPQGQRFDLILIIAILASVLVVMLDSIGSVARDYHDWLRVAEWTFTLLFTVEYVLRIYASPHPGAYIRSFYGIIDLLSILPTYLAFFFPELVSLLVIRLLRVLRIFRVLKLLRFLTDQNILFRAMFASRHKILVFFSSMLIMTTIIGALMYIVEGPQYGYSSIPKSIYWAIVTITTVGYGDITPHTPLGQFLAAFTMLLGYSIIAVPTGIVTAEIAHELQRDRSLRTCPNCERRGHDADAHYCKHCGASMDV